MVSCFHPICVSGRTILKLLAACINYFHSISSYQGALERRVKALANCIEERAGLDVEAGSVDITLCFQHWSYDLMVDNFNFIMSLTALLTTR